MREAATICPAPCKLTFDLESGVRVTCEVAYLFANFSLPRPLCSRLRPDVRDRRQTLDRQVSDAHHRLMPPTLGAGGGQNKYAYTTYKLYAERIQTMMMMMVMMMMMMMILFWFL